MTWLNLDINGCEIENPDVIYCENCGSSDLPICKPIDDLMESYHCARCDQFLWLGWTEYGVQFMNYLLSNSEWDEGLSGVWRRPYPPF